MNIDYPKKLPYIVFDAAQNSHVLIISDIFDDFFGIKVVSAISLRTGIVHIYDYYSLF